MPFTFSAVKWLPVRMNTRNVKKIISFDEVKNRLMLNDLK